VALRGVLPLRRRSNFLRLDAVFLHQIRFARAVLVVGLVESGKNPADLFVVCAEDPGGIPPGLSRWRSGSIDHHGLPGWLVMSQYAIDVPLPRAVGKGLIAYADEPKATASRRPFQVKLAARPGKNYV
jgi:hypothetical protein